MLAWFRRLFAAPSPPPPRLVELAERIADVEHAMAKWGARLEDSTEALNARITNAMRRKARQDDPGETNGEPASPEPTTPRYAPTAHLARRFRSF